MSENMIRMIVMLLYIVAGPFIGGILDGFDRKISARMQGRKGPTVLQPFSAASAMHER